MSAAADVLMVGAGGMGGGTDFHLARLGAGSVTVLDRAAAGSGMSSRSSALVRMHYTFPPEVDLAARSDTMCDAWTELTGRPGCVRRTGFVRLVHHEEAELLRANVAMQRAHGAQAEVIDAAELARLAPGLCSDDIECAAWEPHGGYGDGAIVAGDLLAAAREAGACYRPNTPVRALITDGDRVTGAETSAGLVHAGVTVVACGGWSRPVLAAGALARPV